MNLNSNNSGAPKKIIYFYVTVIVLILASFIIGLIASDFFKLYNNKNISEVTTSAPAEPITETEALPETEPVIETKPVTETVPVTETEPVTVTETVPVTEKIIPGEEPVSPIIKQLGDIETSYPDTVLAFTDDKGEDYIKRIVFLGDSTTYGLKKYGILSDGIKTKQVWTPVSGTLTLSYASFATILYPEDGSEITIADAVSQRKPDILVITLGINGISFMNETYFKSEYSKLISIIKKANPDTKIILQSIFPVAKSYVNKKSINNNKIADANTWIVAIAKEAGVKYANTALVLIGSNGYLPEEYQNGDGLHLNETSFAIELKYLRTHVYPEAAEVTTAKETEP